MGQFDRFIDRGAEPPPLLLRTFQVLFPAAWVAKAVTTHTLQDIMAAVLFVALMLPAAIAPKAVHSRLTAWEHDRPLLSDFLGVLLTACLAFVTASWFLDRTPSALIAIALGVVSVVAGRLRRNQRNSSAG